VGAFEEVAEEGGGRGISGINGCVGAPHQFLITEQGFSEINLPIHVELLSFLPRCPFIFIDSFVGLGHGPTCAAQGRSQGSI
jgi:hypothetical protein